jgi:hypothetical protein
MPSVVLDSMLNFTQGGESSTEFDKLFTKRTKKDYTYWKLKKKDVLDQCDRFYFQLPKLPEAISKTLNLAINNGITFENQDDKQKKAQDLEKFEDSLPVNQQEFLYDIGRYLLTKGNILVRLGKNKTTDQIQWGVVEPHRFEVMTLSDESASAKYSIVGFSIKEKKNQPPVEYLIKDTPNLIYLRSAIRSVLGVPPIILNQMVSNTIIGAIQRQYMIENGGAFSKDVFYPKPLGDKPNNMPDSTAKQLTKDINSILQDPTKATFVTNKALEKVTINTVSGNPQFWNDYATKFITHSASLAGLAPSFLLPPGEINRSTKEQEYKEMVQYTIKPLNLLFSRLVKQMFAIWKVYAKSNIELNLTVENPKAALDMDYRLLEMIELVQLNLVKPNELRSQLGLEDLTEEDIAKVNDIIQKRAEKPALTQIPK